MILSELCRKSGLTEPTVCFYIQEGFLPYFPSGSDPYAYDAFYDRDAVWLTRAAGLRRAGFALADIRRMLADPAAVPEVVEIYRRQLAQDVGFWGRKFTLMKGVERIPSESLRNVEHLAAYIQPYAEKLPLPPLDRYPRQSPLAGRELARQEENEALVLHRIDQDMLDRRGKGLTTAIVIVEGILLFAQALFVMDAFSVPAGLLLLVIAAVVLIAFARGVVWMKLIMLAWAVTSILVAGFALSDVTAPSGAAPGVIIREFSYSEEWLEHISPEALEQQELEMEQKQAREELAKRIVAVLLCLFIAYKLVLCVVLITNKAIDVYMYNMRN